MDINKVIKIYRHEHVVQIVMEDRENHNMLSTDLREGIILAFDTVNQDKTIKVVVLHGYDNYFCCGGTKDELMSIYEKKYNFQDMNIYDVLLRCEVPVISAMQGHALGGGLAMGCFADMVILSRQSIYSANFMNYGFTPGFGSTYILPKIFGDILGREMLFTAKNYYGDELKNRGVNLLVLDRADVIDTALTLAQQIAEKPRTSLVELKAHFRKMIASELKSHIENELLMHEVTFQQPEVKENIQKLNSTSSS